MRLQCAGTSGVRPRWFLTAALVAAGILAPSLRPDLGGSARAGRTFTISGRIVCGLFGFGIKNVVLYGLPGDPKTNGDGYYSATVPEGWVGAAYPIAAGLHFDPFGRNYVNVTADIVSNYKTTLPFPQIWGVVTTAAGAPIEGVLMEGLPRTPLTNFHGFYLAGVSYGASCTVRPQKQAFTFHPSTRSYQNVNSDQGNENYTGTPTAGISVTPTSGLVTTEMGGTATFTIALTNAPTGNVTIGLSSDDTTEGTVSPTGVTFTPLNWATPQTVTVTGVDDPDVDGDIAYNIVTAPATSSDERYNGLDAPNVAVRNRDNEAPPLLQVVPAASFDFGRCEVGDTIERDAFTVTNAGGSILTGSVSTADGKFRIVSGNSFTLAAGASQVVRMAFAPAAAIAYSQPVTFTSNAGNATRTVRGTGGPHEVIVDNADAEPERRFEPVSGTWLQAATQPNRWGADYHYSTGSVAAWHYRVRYNGIYEVAAWWPTPAASWSTSVPYTIVHALGSTTVRVNQRANGGRWNVLGRFELYAATDWRVEIANDTPGATVVADAVRITWVRGVTPALAVDPGVARDLGLARIGTGKEVDAYVVRNAGEGRLVGTVTTAPPFQIVAGDTFDLGTGARQTVRIRFDPPAEGVHDGTVSFTSNVGWTTRGVSGRGVTSLPPVLAVDPATDVSFGRVMCGDAAELDAYTVRNDGDEPLTGSVRACAPFSIVAGATFNLPGGASQTVRVRFAPTLATRYVLPLAFTSNGGSTTRMLRGEGEFLFVDNRDDASDRRFVVLAGVWAVSRLRPYPWAGDYVSTPAGDGSSVAAWYFKVPSDGIYEVAAWWPRSVTWGRSVPFTVSHRNGTTTVRKDQRVGGGAWNRLGTFQFTAGDEWGVEVTNGSPGISVCADAIRLRWLGPLP